MEQSTLASEIRQVTEKDGAFNYGSMDPIMSALLKHKANGKGCLIHGDGDLYVG